MNLGQGITATLILLVLGVSLLNPEGWVLALVLAAGILIAYGFIQFFPEYMLATNQGKKARQNKRRDRRASGLIPFRRTSKRENRSGRQSNSSSDGDQRE